jgi:hypothetical protein
MRARAYRAFVGLRTADLLIALVDLDDLLARALPRDLTQVQRHG